MYSYIAGHIFLYMKEINIFIYVGDIHLQIYIYTPRQDLLQKTKTTKTPRTPSVVL